MTLRTIIRCNASVVFSFALLGSVAVNADSSSLRLTGFVSLVGGSVLSGDFSENYSGPTNINKTECPCYIADWGNAGNYNNDFSVAQESRIGVQANYKFTPEASVTGQLVSRGTDATPDIQWAYGSYKIGSQWEVQLGRKRIPLYYYSDFQDIGVSYPWISPPPELYGWEATNYNGTSLRFNTQIENINVTSSVFAGAEKVKNSSYQKLYYAGPNEVDWDNIIGGDIELNYEFLTMRLVYMTSSVRTQIKNDSIDNTADLNAYGVAVNLDFDRVFIVSEFTQLTRDFKALDYSYKAPALTLGAGLRFGKWTPFINYAKYLEASSDVEKYIPQGFTRTGVTLRYDISSSSDIKVQLDRNNDTTHNFSGDTTIFRVSYDHVFE